MKPPDEYFIGTYMDGSKGIFRTTYHESQSGKYWIARVGSVFPWAKKIRPRKTFYFKYDEQ